MVLLCVLLLVVSFLLFTEQKTDHGHSARLIFGGFAGGYALMSLMSTLM